MPKRPNPFGDTAPLQFKTHVGVKELDMGSGQAELMKIVYEKTQEKLFKGAQQLSDVNDNSMQSLDVCKDSPIDMGCSFEPRQALLDNTGQLIAPARVKSPVLPPVMCDDSSLDCGPSNLHDPHRMEAHCQEDMACDNQSLNTQATSNQGASEGQNFNTTLIASSIVQNFVPAPSGQLCLTAGGQLIPRHTPAIDSAMDCDMESTEAVGVDQNDCEFSGPSQIGGCLLAFGFRSSRQSSKKKIINQEVCCTCRQLPGPFHCQFCEQAVCASCMRHCHACSERFCQLCSTLNYDMDMERAFCLSCASAIG